MCIEPAAPITIVTRPSLLVTMVGHMDDIGRLPGVISLAKWNGGRPEGRGFELGSRKSFISSLNMIPVREPTRPDPNLCLILKSNASTYQHTTCNMNSFSLDLPTYHMQYEFIFT